MNKPRKRMTEVLAAYKTEMKSRQQRGWISRDIVFREFANGRVLFQGKDAEEALCYYGPGGMLEKALERCTADFRGLNDRELDQLQIGLVLDEQTGKFVFVLVYIQR